MYKIEYSPKRRTVSIMIKDGLPVVKAPLGVSKNKIDEIVKKNQHWIRENIEKYKIKESRFSTLTELDILRLKQDARIYFNDKIAYFSEIMNLKPSRVTVTSAKTRFGSCSAKGSICFSYRLMLYPEKAREYVVVHELAHLVHMNHSRNFYKLIEKYLPDYNERRRLLDL